MYTKPIFLHKSPQKITANFNALGHIFNSLDALKLCREILGGKNSKIARRSEVRLIKLISKKKSFFDIYVI